MLLEPELVAWRAARAESGLGINGPVHELREIVNAIVYLDRTGIAWAYLPHDFPPPSTVYGYYAEWQQDGTTERLHELLRRRVRTDATRWIGSAPPSRNCPRASGPGARRSPSGPGAGHDQRADPPGRARAGPDRTGRRT